MYYPLFSTWLSGYECLTQTLAGILRKQCQWLHEQHQLRMKMWTAMKPLAPTSESVAVPRAENDGALQAKVRERLGKGLAPPREIYDVQNRGHIDWTRIPDWAQPADPDAFEGCGHEG